MLQAYLKLTKNGITLFVLFTAFCGYFLGIPEHRSFDGLHFTLFLLGVYLLTAGSFALNQVEEKSLDLKMKRTSLRPLPQKQLSSFQSLALSFFLVIFGLFFLYVAEPISCYLGFLTLILYNVFYTLVWKRKWAFGAVPGAIPGAFPVLLGYSASSSPYPFLNPESVYLFFVMFFWQMPHFWAIAIRYQKDYEKGGVPVLPVKLGKDRTLFHIGLYLLFYLILVISSPLFVKVYWAYLLLVIPMVLKTFWEFFQYSQNEMGVPLSKASSTAWLRFFLWINLSLPVFVLAPVLDRWLFF